MDYSGDSPCILDQSCSLFEVATVSAAIPNGGLSIPKFTLPRSMESVLTRMRDLYFAHQQVFKKIKLFVFAQVEEGPLVLLLSGSSGSGKKLLSERLAIATHQNIISSSNYEIWSEVSAQTEQKLKNLVEKG